VAVNTLFIRHQTLIRIGAEADAVVHPPGRPWHFLVEERELFSRWAADDGP
jgi:hypothetical protein